LTRLHGPNAVLSGVFLDAAPTSLSLLKPEALSALDLNDGRLTFSIPAFPGLHVCVDRSSNLFDWQCTATNLVTGSTAQITTYIDVFEPQVFFRTRLVP
jgi:hypothetical protein